MKTDEEFLEEAKEIDEELPSGHKSDNPALNALKNKYPDISRDKDGNEIPLDPNEFEKALDNKKENEKQVRGQEKQIHDQDKPTSKRPHGDPVFGRLNKELDVIGEELDSSEQKNQDKPTSKRSYDDLIFGEYNKQLDKAKREADILEQIDKQIEEQKERKRKREQEESDEQVKRPKNTEDSNDLGHNGKGDSGTGSNNNPPLSSPTEFVRELQENESQDYFD